MIGQLRNMDNRMGKNILIIEIFEREKKNSQGKFPVIKKKCSENWNK